MAPDTTDVANAAKAALEAAKTAAIAAGKSAVYKGEPTDSDRPTLPRHYQVLHVTTGSAVGKRLTGSRSGERYRIIVRSVGLTYDEACWESDRAKAALDDKVLTLAGFDWGKNLDDADRPIAPDNDVAPAEYDGVRVWMTVIKPLPS